MSTDPATAPADSLTAASTKEVHLPTFCPINANSWFRRAEVQFRCKNITQESRKADFVLAALPDDVFSSMSEWLDDLGDTSALYTPLKEFLLKEFVPAPEERAERLMQMTKQPLGDQRASTAFREMKALTRLPPDSSGTLQQLDLLRILWLLRLPDSVRAGITNFNDISESDLLKRADALQNSTKAATRRPIFAATSCHDALQPQNLSIPEGPEEDDQMAAAAYQRSRLAYKNFSSHRKFTNQPQPLRGTTPKKAEDNSPYCYFHTRFGHAARKCRQPCAWPKNV